MSWVRDDDSNPSRTWPVPPGRHTTKSRESCRIRAENPTFLSNGPGHHGFERLYTRRLLCLLSCADDHWPIAYGRHRPVRHPGIATGKITCECLPSRGTAANEAPGPCV